MKISKTGFINLIRCDRFAALEEINRNKEDSIVTFSENLDDLMTTENINKRNLLLEEIKAQEDEPTNSDVMQPYYNEVEYLTARAVKHYFDGELIYDANTFKQARYNAEVEGYQFYCFLDGLLHADDGVKVFETKATTTRKFLDMEVKKEPIFIRDSDGILKLKRDLGYDVDKAYDKKEASFFDRYSEVGRYVYDLAFQRFVMERSKGFDKTKNNRYYLAILSSEYVFDGKYDEYGKAVYPIEIIDFIDFTEITERYMPIIENDAKIVTKRLNTMNANPTLLGKHCQVKKNRECKYKDICFKALPDNVSLLNYIDNHCGFKAADKKHETYDLLNAGKVHMLDIPRDWLNRENNQIQYDVVKYKEPYYNKEKMIAGINEIKYPIYHLDFESFPCPLPRFKGEKAYSQSLFQFSIHVEREPGVCDKEKDHYSFLAKDHSDVREELIKEMLNVIKPDGGTILVYNISFEKTRIRELGNLYPQYAARLEDISNRLFDLIYIVRTNGPLYRSLGYSDRDSRNINYYHENLGGSYSIKKVLPLFTNLSYASLNIANGEEAYVAYANFPKLDEETFKQTYDDLVEYCQQDTWAMVEVLNGLRKKVGLL
ncbi:MAG TPA: DUF2779 domain-containing protein [Acholeplasma sp.]|jgi:hypothetical protein|nr:DUF2779 domain-containing protein [Acholeplasma sp.]